MLGRHIKSPWLQFGGALELPEPPFRRTCARGAGHVFGLGRRDAAAPLNGLRTAPHRPHCPQRCCWP
jgi:hypothetical protein